MVSKILIFFSVISLINVATGESAPFITPCKGSDTECAMQNAVNAIPYFADGIPNLGVETLDPVFFKLVDSSSPNLKLVLSDLTITGLKTCKPTKIQSSTGTYEGSILVARLQIVGPMEKNRQEAPWIHSFQSSIDGEAPPLYGLYLISHDVSKTSFQIQLSCVVKLDGDYDLDGNLLFLPITGKGKIHVFLRKLLIDVDLQCTEKIGKDGETHYRIKTFKYNYDLQDKSDVVFEGLFAENEVLKKATEDLMKHRGNEVVKEIGVNIFKVAIAKIVENCNKFFIKVPKQELTLD